MYFRCDGKYYTAFHKNFRLYPALGLRYFENWLNFDESCVMAYVLGHNSAH